MPRGHGTVDRWTAAMAARVVMETAQQGTFWRGETGYEEARLGYMWNRRFPKRYPELFSWAMKTSVRARCQLLPLRAFFSSFGGMSTVLRKVLWLFLATITAGCANTGVKNSADFATSLNEL